jgi:hypothetical protein
VGTDGRYVGGNEELFVVLRVDVARSGVLSGDISRGEDYLASMRTQPGVRITGAQGRWAAVWQDGQGATSTGTLATEAVADHPDRLRVTMRLGTALAGLRPQTDLVAVVEWSGEELRDLRLEVETEADVRPAGPVDFHGAAEGVRECLRAAGFAVGDIGEASRIPRPPQPWDYSKIFTILNDLMASAATADLTRAAWNVHLLQLSRCSLEGLAGIMFDETDPLPRQGSAVFVDRIRDAAKDGDSDRQILRTVVHELGHALNLVHRFERAVGRADSTSFMNYPSRYRLGGHTAEYWADFAYTFDPDELEFLRHAPQAAIRPGDAAFHSVPYWTSGAGGYVPYLPAVAEPGLRLSLQAPANGPVFAFGQPVLLGITLENLTTTPIEFGSDPLDPKTGGVEILIQRVTGGADNGARGAAATFLPMMRGCVVEDDLTRVSLPAAGTLRDNVNLTFGSGGFSFAEPGTYDLVPLLGLPLTGPDGTTVEHLVRGAALRIRVGYPHEPADERDALVLLRPDVGAWFALGGSDCLTAASDDLSELCERRRARNGAADPVVAGITRGLGINAGRGFVRLRDGRFEQRAGDPGRAADLLGGLDAVTLRTFDASTAAGTADLARRYAADRG